MLGKPDAGPRDPCDCILGTQPDDLRNEGFGLRKLAAIRIALHQALP